MKRNKVVFSIKRGGISYLNLLGVLFFDEILDLSLGNSNEFVFSRVKVVNVYEKVLMNNDVLENY